MRRHAFATAGEPETVGGGRRDRDRGAHRSRQHPLRLGPPRRRAWDGCRSAGRRRCRSRSPRSHPPAVSVRKATPVAPAHSGSVGAVVAAEVTEPGGAEQRVAGGVGDDVTVGVAAGPTARRTNIEPGHPHGVTGLESMDVVPMPTRTVHLSAGSRSRRSPTFLWARARSAPDWLCLPRSVAAKVPARCRDSMLLVR